MKKGGDVVTDGAAGGQRGQRGAGQHAVEHGLGAELGTGCELAAAGERRWGAGRADQDRRLALDRETAGAGDGEMDDAAADAGGAERGGADHLGARVKGSGQAGVAGDGERAVDGELDGGRSGGELDVLHQDAEAGFVAGGEEAGEERFGD